MTPSPAWNPEGLKIFLAGNTFGISAFPGKIPSKAEVFPAGKISISDIPGFPAGDRGSLIKFFKTVNEPYIYLISQNIIDHLIIISRTSLLL